MYLYTAHGHLIRNNIIENFDENKIDKFCFNKDDNKICIDFKLIKTITDKFNIDKQINKKYSLHPGKYISGKSSLHIYKTDLEKCKMYCNNESWCKSFSYNFKNYNCLLSNVNKENNNFSSNYNINYYEKIN